MSLLGSITGADAAGRAASQTLAASKSAYKKQMKLAQPGINAYNSGLVSMTNLVNKYRNDLGKDSSILKAQNEMGQKDIIQRRNASLAGSRRFFSATGNSAMGRGEAFRINNAADEQTSALNLNTAIGQEAYRTDAQNRYFTGVQSMLGAGESGVNLAAGAANNLANGQAQAAQMTAQASMMNSGFMTNLLGMYLGSPSGPWYSGAAKK